MAKVNRRPTTFLTQAELFAIAEAKTEEAQALPAGALRNERLASAGMYRRLGELRGWLNAGPRKPKMATWSVEQRSRD